MKKSIIKNSFKKVMLSFEANRSYFNFVRFLIAGFVAAAAILALYIYYESLIVLTLMILPVSVFWKAHDFYKASKSAAQNLRDMHNGEISDEIKKFSAKGFKKNL